VHFGPGEEACRLSLPIPTRRCLCRPVRSLNVGLNDGFTLEAWIAPSNTSSGMPIFEWNTGAAVYGVHFYGFPSANFMPTAWTRGGGDHIVQTGFNLFSTNSFQHVALTYSKSSGNTTIYCNGSVVLQQNIGAVSPQTSYNLYLGKRTLEDGVSFSGSLDEMSVYNRALGASEIQAVYAAGCRWLNALRPARHPFPCSQQIKRWVTTVRQTLRWSPAAVPRFPTNGFWRL